MMCWDSTEENKNRNKAVKNNAHNVVSNEMREKTENRLTEFKIS